MTGIKITYCDNSSDKKKDDDDDDDESDEDEDEKRRSPLLTFTDTLLGRFN